MSTDFSEKNESYFKLSLYVRKAGLQQEGTNNYQTENIICTYIRKAGNYQTENIICTYV